MVAGFDVSCEALASGSEVGIGFQPPSEGSVSMIPALYSPDGTGGVPNYTLVQLRIFSEFFLAPLGGN